MLINIIIKLMIKVICDFRLQFIMHFKSDESNRHVYKIEKCIYKFAYKHY